MTMHEMLVATRNELARRPFAHAWHTPEGGTCLMGAFLIATGNQDICTVAAARTGTAEMFAQTLGLISVFHAIAWNDRQSKEDVLALLDAAIARTAPEPVNPLAISEREMIAA